MDASSAGAPGPKRTRSTRAITYMKSVGYRKNSGFAPFLRMRPVTDAMVSSSGRVKTWGRPKRMPHKRRAPAMIVIAVRQRPSRQRDPGRRGPGRPRVALSALRSGTNVGVECSGLHLTVSLHLDPHPVLTGFRKRVRDSHPTIDRHGQHLMAGVRIGSARLREL